MRNSFTAGIAALVVIFVSCNGTGSTSAQPGCDSLAIVIAYQKAHTGSFYGKGTLEKLNLVPEKHGIPKSIDPDQAAIYKRDYGTDSPKYMLPVFNTTPGHEGNYVRGFVVDPNDFADIVKNQDKIKTLSFFFGINGFVQIPDGKGGTQSVPRYTLLIQTVAKPLPTTRPGPDDINYYDFVDPCPGGPDCP